MGKLAMIAFGGNALLKAGQKGTYEEQLANVRSTCHSLMGLVNKGYDIVIGHGNGPQVGNALLRHEAGSKQFGLQSMPMDFCGAETQGSIAYMIETGMEKELRAAGIDRKVVSIVTRVEVSPDDPGFLNPTKPVGPYYSREDASSRPGQWREDPAGRGWRKVVASPKPIRINNIEIVEKLAREGNIVVTVGGGGIPVVKDPEGYKGVEAVIDKDLASALAALTIKADLNGPQGQSRHFVRRTNRRKMRNNRSREPFRGLLRHRDNSLTINTIWHSILETAAFLSCWTSPQGK